MLIKLNLSIKLNIFDWLVVWIGEKFEHRWKNDGDKVK